LSGNWTFRPFVSSPPSLIQRFLLILLLIQLKPKHHRLYVLTIFQRSVRGAHGACGAVFRDTPILLADFVAWFAFMSA